MNLRDLEYLVALADLRHFGKAADACFVSQPALSMQIKKLEETLGVQLLERTNKSVLMTAIGITIAEQARKILQQTQELREIAKSAKDPYAGELKIGIIPTLAPYLLPHIIPGLAAKFPKLTIYLVEKQTSILLDKLENGKIDAAILALPLPGADFTTRMLFDEEFLLAVPKDHPLTKRKTIRSQDLENQNIMLLEEGHCMREQALSFCQRINSFEANNFRATSLETLRHMVSANNAMTLLPKLACKPDRAIMYIPFSAPKPIRTIGLIWRTATAKQIVLDEIATHIINTIKI